MNIDKGIEIPKKRERAKWPFGQMEIGDSFLVPIEIRAKVAASASWYVTRHGWKFTVRTVPDGLRVWRIQ